MILDVELYAYHKYHPGLCNYYAVLYIYLDVKILHHPCEGRNKEFYENDLQN